MSDREYFGIPGHCVSIDGDLWHEPGKCEGSSVNCNGQCCGYVEKPTLADYERWAAEDITALRAQLPTHPPLELCKVDECAVCGVRDCPHDAMEHYWKDGCPACYAAAGGKRGAAAVDLVTMPTPGET